MTGGRALRPVDGLRILAVALLLVQGGIHLQLVLGHVRGVPTINVLFVLNVIGAAAIALMLAGSRERIAVMAALAGLGLTLGALVSLAISRASTLFDYSEPTLSTPVLLAAVVELFAVLALAGFVLARLRESASTNPTVAHLTKP